MQSHFPTNSRQLALDALSEWSEGQAFASDIVGRLATEHQLDPRDAALLQNLVFTVLRNKTLIDHWIAHLSNMTRIEDHVLWIVRLGLVQLLILELPPYAAVNETVKLAPHAGALVNAILRRAQRESAQLFDEAASLPLHVRFSHPEWLVQRWVEQFGHDHTVQLCEWNQKPARGFIRVNRLHPQPLTDEELSRFDRTNRQDFYQPDLPPRDWLAQGRCYVQDPSTAEACDLLAPKPGEVVLDACAAPGGKTALLAQMMENRGRIIACDSSARRIPRLQENLRRMRVGIARTYEHDWLLPKGTPPWGAMHFDRILVDAPCSNTGVMRRRIDVRWRLQPAVFPDMASTQLRILQAVLPLLKPGGSLVYGTCSIDAEENESVIQEALKQHQSFELAETKATLPWRDGVDGSFSAKVTCKN
ncbi:MAG: 16S rRNA (cytosine(967)-C(5))-methyltransferase RsmB [Verrucomicrobiaceae bacterium]